MVRKLAFLLSFAVIPSWFLVHAVPAGATQPLVDALACRKVLTKKGLVYAKTRRTHLMKCVEKLLKCELALEAEGVNPNACRSAATTACTAKLGNAADSAINKAKTKFHDATVLGCAAYGLTDVLSNAAGGLWFSNDATCGASADLNTLSDCLRGRMDEEVDAHVGRVQPRAGLLLDNIGLGSLYPNLPRPTTTTVTISATGAGSGDLVNPGTINLPSGNALKIVGDNTTLPCGGGPGSNGKLTVAVSTAVDPCNDAMAQQFVLKEPYGASEFAIFGPYGNDQKICVSLKDASCDDSEIGDVNVPDSDPAPTTASADMLKCQKTLDSAARKLAVTTGKALHKCADMADACKLAEAIDAEDPTQCLSAATTACGGITTSIGTALAKAKSKVSTKCVLITYSDLRAFAGGIGFSNSNAGCSGAANLTALLDCTLGVTGVGGTAGGTKCQVEKKVFVRDPRAANSLGLLGLAPATNFPCVGP